MKGLEYNSQLPPLKINEYGRNLQRFVSCIIKEEDKSKRTALAEALVTSVLQINPHLKEVDNGDEIVWNCLHTISDFKLDVDSPYPKPEPLAEQPKPKRLTYPISRIKYRYYGKNLQKLVDNVEQIETIEFKKPYLDMLGSFMKNSGKNWNDEDMTDKQIVEHLKILSQGKIIVSAEEINADIELRQRTTNTYKKKGKRNNNSNHKYNKNRRR